MQAVAIHQGKQKRRKPVKLRRSDAFFMWVTLSAEDTRLYEENMVGE